MRASLSLTAVAALVGFASGCGASVLIPDDDLAYHRALLHLEHTQQLVAASQAPDEDRAMFLQAESMFRYRFAPPGKSFASYAAQAAAAAIDLPVLDSFAGALDLYSLRIRSYDGAVHIWETLLARHPATPLRPLVLYRLGWAYRSSLASGLPGSTDLAFDELARRRDTPLAPLAAEAVRVPWKSQGTATALSIVPGLGQIYTGETGNGAVRIAVALAAATAVVVPSALAYERRHDLSFRHDWPLLAIGIAGAIALTIDYSSSYQDALRAVVMYNEAREAEFEDRHPTAP